MGLKRIMKKSFLSSTLVMSMMMLTACSSTGDGDKVSLRYSTRSYFKCRLLD